MPTSAELITHQRQFEGARGLDTFNTLDLAIDRMQEELDEAKAELKTGDTMALLFEVIDTVIFAHSIFSKLCYQLGIPEDYVDNYIDQKMEHNFNKYHEDHFDLVGLEVGGKTYTTRDAIDRARHHHNHELPEGNDAY